MPFVYLLRCRDDSFYVGSTFDLDRRVTEHNEGLGAAYTRRRRPVQLVWTAEVVRIEDAFRIEKQIQGWSRAKRQALIDGRPDLLPALSRGRSGRRDQAG